MPGPPHSQTISCLHVLNVCSKKQFPHKHIYPSINHFIPLSTKSYFQTKMGSGPEDNIPTILINCVRNNIHFTVSDRPGNTLFKLSAGTAGFKGTNKTSHKTAISMVDTLREQMLTIFSPKTDTHHHAALPFKLNFRGFNAARSVIIGQIRRCGFKITEIIDTTGVPFNGCRPPKSRRL